MHILLSLNGVQLCIVNKYNKYTQYFWDVIDFFQLAVIFIQECDGFKDLTHMHSFAHDFHLRAVQSYLSGKYVSLVTLFSIVNSLHGREF